jgi:hypothetical protein
MRDCIEWRARKSQTKFAQFFIDSSEQVVNKSLQNFSAIFDLEQPKLSTNESGFDFGQAQSEPKLAMNVPRSITTVLLSQSCPPFFPLLSDSHRPPHS